MALTLSLIIFLTLLCTLGKTATPYFDFGLGLSRRPGNDGSRIGRDRGTELSLARRPPTFSSISKAAHEEDEILDVVLLATIDGKFHALNRTDGTILWSMHNSFTTDCAVGEQERSLLPLIRTPHMLHPLGADEDEDSEEKIYIVEPQSGSIYVLPPRAKLNTPISKLAFTVPELVEMSPAAFPGDETKTFTGRKETSLIAIDLDTGAVKGIVDTDRECLWDPVLGNQEETESVNLDDLEDGVTRKREVYVGRTDYTLQIRSSRPKKGGKRRVKPRTQTLLYSSYGPNTIHRGLQAVYKNSLDGLYVQSLPGGEIIAFDTNERSVVGHGKVEKKILRWGNRLDEPVVATFDILYPSKREFNVDVDSEQSGPYILLQPVPDISRIFEDYSPQKDREGLGYVGIVNDSLYVLGSEGFPLAAFSDPPQARISRHRKPDLLEGEVSGNEDPLTHPFTVPDQSKADHSRDDENEDSDDTCSTLECLRGLRKWQNSTTSVGEIEGPLEMSGSLHAEQNGWGQQQEGSQRLGIGGSVTNSKLWWAKLFATVGALLAGFAIAILVGTRSSSLWKIISKSATTKRPIQRGPTLVPEIIVSPPSGDPVEPEEEEITSSTVVPVVEKSLPPLPETVHFEPAHVQEAVRVDTEGPESGKASKPNIVMVNFPPVPEPCEPTLESKEDSDWVLTPSLEPVSDEPSSTDAVAALAESEPLPISHPLVPDQQVETMASDTQYESISLAVDETSNVQESPLYPLESQSSPPPEVQQPAEPTPEEDVEAEPEVEVETTQQEAKKKKNRTRSRAKKKKAAFAREVEEREREKEREKAEKEKEAADRVIEKVVMEIEAERRVEPVQPVSSLVVSEEILGFGSHGTMVFKGSFQGRAVAVKRLLNDFVTLASREVTLLQESDAHPNVIRYYFQEARYNFLYIALELCPASLADIVERPDNPNYTEISCNFDPKKALNQISSGLRWLHGLKIVHRDIKPQNILVAQPQSNRNSRGVTYRMLISDFGLCKKLGADETSFLPTIHGVMAAGTVGWRAPEILRGEVKIDDSSLNASDETSQSSRGSTGTVGGSTSSNRTRLTKSVDIFALGCLFYYTLTSGGHPFGDRYEREGNIMKGARDLSGLESFGEEGMEAIDLIGKMVADDSAARPDTTTILLHPFFWNPGRRLAFLQDASDRFEIMCRDPKEAPLVMLETDASSVVGYDWHSRLDRTFIDNLGKFRKYNGGSVQDLMRALRNKKHHYQDLPDNVKRNLGPLPEGFLAYFTRRFPKLFLHVYYVVSACGLSHESMFKSYFELQEA